MLFTERREADAETCNLRGWVRGDGGGYELTEIGRAIAQAAEVRRWIRTGTGARLVTDDDDAIAQEIVWEIARRKGFIKNQVDPDSGIIEKYMAADRDWLIDALLAVRPIVAAAR